MSTLERAIAIAAEAHAGQVDKAGFPYILHPLRVMGAMRSYEGQIVGVLHDVVEDCPPWSIEALAAQGFGREVTLAVDQLTRGRGVPYESYIENLARIDTPLARAVKIADLRDNLSPRRTGCLSTAERERLERRYRPALRRLAGAADVRGSNALTSAQSLSRRELDAEAVPQLRAARVWLGCVVQTLEIDPAATAILFPADRDPRQGCEVEVTIAARGRPPVEAGDMGGCRVSLAHTLAQIDACLAGEADG